MTTVPHGTVTRYNDHDCRCDHCTEARRLSAARYRAGERGRDHGWGKGWCSEVVPPPPVIVIPNADVRELLDVIHRRGRYAN